MSAPERVTLYPHGGEREWSTTQWDEWKANLGVEYVRADIVEQAGKDFDQLFYLRAVLGSIASGYPFRGVKDPREIADRTLKRDWEGL